MEYAVSPGMCGVMLAKCLAVPVGVVAHAQTMPASFVLNDLESISCKRFCQIM